MGIQIHPDFSNFEPNLLSFVENFNKQGTIFGDGKRNIIKIFDLNEKKVNIKSFKKPNFYNKIIYKFIRKSKAQRSYDYANLLLKNKIGTPQPIAFIENFDLFGLNASYYLSEHLTTELTFRELVQIPNYPDHENILRQFTRFCFDLHEKGIEFLDHSPGNTLIEKSTNGKYNFYLVDLNRMEFHEKMDFDSRMNNLRRLTPKQEMIAVMSNEYAKFYDKSEQEIFENLWKKTSDFQYKYFRKLRIKKKLNFWK